jgi:DNA-binding IclR family transcriptional regulator
MATTAAVRGGGVDAAEVVGQILQALLELRRPARLKDLETKSGIASAKLHRYLVSMGRCGLVTREAGGQGYDFGLLAYRMGQVAAHNENFLSLLAPDLEVFAAKLDRPELGQVVGIAQWVGRGATVVRWFESNSPLSIRSKPGIALSITASATAKLLAAWQPREVTEPLVRQELQEQGRGKDAAVAAVYREYEQIRSAGIASSKGARRSEVNALCVPVSERGGKVVAGVTMLGMAPHFEASPTSRAAKMLRELGRDLSGRLGESVA